MEGKEKKHGYNFSSDNFLFKQQQQATRSQQFNLIPLSPQRLLTRLRCLLVACEPVMFQQFCPTDDARRKFPQHQIHHLCPPPPRQLRVQKTTDKPEGHRGGGREGGREVQPTQSSYTEKRWKTDGRRYSFRIKGILSPLPLKGVD